MRLTTEDAQWLRDYEQVVGDQFPGLVKRIIIYGSKARGTATIDSDLDLVLLIREGDRRLKDAVSWAGYDLSIGTEVVPSILVYTLAEWERLREQESVFREAVERDGVLVG